MRAPPTPVPIPMKPTMSCPAPAPVRASPKPIKAVSFLEILEQRKSPQDHLQ